MKTITFSLGEVNSPWRLVHDYIGEEECPYMRRSFIQTPLGTLRLHRFMRSDDDRALHDHPWPFVTLVLRGGYRDISEQGVDVLRPGSVRYRPALHRHRVEVDGPATTIVITGRKQRTWGFWKGRSFTPWRKYMQLHGSPACADLDLTRET